MELALGQSHSSHGAVSKNPLDLNLDILAIHLGMLDRFNSLFPDVGEQPEEVAGPLRICNAHRGQMATLSADVAAGRAKGSDALSYIMDNLPNFTMLVQGLNHTINYSLMHKSIGRIEGVQNAQITRQSEDIDLIINSLKGITGNSQFSDVDMAVTRQAEQNVQSLIIPDYQDSQLIRNDPYAFTARIIQEHSEGTEVRAMLDTGCSDNWVSLEVVRRAGIQNQIEELQNPRQYTGFGNATLEPVGTIAITWSGLNSGLSRRTTFLVHEQVPFDLVIGKYFLNAENILIFNEPALALRHAHLTKDELNAMEGQVVEKKMQDNSLAAIRKARQAADRQRKREEKAALSRNQTSSNTGSQGRFFQEFQYPNQQPASQWFMNSANRIPNPIVVPLGALEYETSLSAETNSTSMVLHGSQPDREEERDRREDSEDAASRLDTDEACSS